MEEDPSMLNLQSILESGEPVGMLSEPATTTTSSSSREQLFPSSSSSFPVVGLHEDPSTSVVHNISSINQQDDFVVSKDIFDWDQLLSDPVVVDAIPPKRSYSVHDNARLLQHRRPNYFDHQTGVGFANFQFESNLPTPMSTKTTTTTTTAASNHLLSRSVSTRNVSDLRRTRDRFFGGAMSGNTPFSTLKNLAQQRAAAAAAATGGAVPNAKIQVASILHLPFNGLLDAVRNKQGLGVGQPDKRDASSISQQQQQQHSTADSTNHAPAKKIKPLEESALHRACCRRGVTPLEIFQLLQRDPMAASRSETIYSHKMVYDHSLNQQILKLVKEPYTYPLNLAICHRQSTAVLDMLMNVAPDILVTPDGKEREGPLSVLLKYSPSDVDNVDRMLLLKPKCVAHRDRHGNTALHIACTRKTALDAVRHMCILYPESMRLRNRQGKTPLGMSLLYTSTCPEDVSNYLREQQQQQTRLYYAT